MACLIIFWIALDSCWPETPSPLNFIQSGLSVFLWCSHSFFIWFHNDVIPVQSLRASPLKGDSTAVWVFSGFWYICFFFSWYFSPFHSLWQNDNIGIKLALFALLAHHNKLAICMSSAASSVVNTEQLLSKQGYNGCNVTIGICGQCQGMK